MASAAKPAPPVRPGPPAGASAAASGEQKNGDSSVTSDGLAYVAKALLGCTVDVTVRGTRTRPARDGPLPGLGLMPPAQPRARSAARLAAWPLGTRGWGHTHPGASPPVTRAPRLARLRGITFALAGNTSDSHASPPFCHQTKAGVTHTGVFAGTCQEGAPAFGVVLRFATPVVAPSESAGDALVTRPLPELTIPASEFASLRVGSDALSGATSGGGVANGEGGSSAALETDAAIGSKRVGRAGRSLVAWQPGESDTPLAAGGDLGGLGGGGRGGGGGPGTAATTKGGKWDQFSANQAHFGVISTFDEDLYTTKLDKSRISGISEEEAARIAHEIESQSSRNFHMAEERGQALGADDDDEEARFSAVIRGGEGDGHGEAAGEDKNDETFGEHSPKSLDDKLPTASGAAAPEVKKTTLGLNPNAKPFSFNPSAKPFMPSAAASPPAGQQNPAAAAAAAAAAMSAAGVYGSGFPGGRGPAMPYGMAPQMGLAQMPGYPPMMMMMGQGGMPMVRVRAPTGISRPRLLTMSLPPHR